uniref:RING-type domain-containing protein n=1 Tax=Panagrolaimus sp. ES5 TaxID=591445 RepID=A0AC34GTP2_9BILA
MAAKEEEENLKNYVTKMESSDTLADLDFNFREMRTCDGPCKGIICSDQLEIFECCHAVCGECLNEMTDIEVRTDKYLCPISSCRHGNAERNVSTAKEYAYLKHNFLRSRRMSFATVSRLTNSDAEAPLSMEHILMFDPKPKLQSPLPSLKEDAKAKSVGQTSSKSEKEYESMSFGSSKIISGTNLVSTTKLTNEPCSSLVTTSPDFYENTTTYSLPSINQNLAATETDCSSSAPESVFNKPSAYSLNTSEYDQELIAELLALSCQTATCFNEDDFDDCTTAETFTYADY